MKNKVLYIILFSITLLATGCSNAMKIPERKNLDSSKYNISVAEDIVPANENSVVQIQGSQKTTTVDEFENLKTITLNDCDITLGQSTIYDLAAACDGTMYFSADFNCYVIEIGGRYTIFAHTQDDTNPAAPLKQIIFNNVFMEDYMLTFNDVTKNDDASVVTSKFGEATNIYETCNSKNRSWEWKSPTGNGTIKLGIIWHDGITSEINFSAENIEVNLIDEPMNTVIPETTEE